VRIGLVADYFPPGRLGGVGEVAASLRDAYEALGAEVTLIRPGVPGRGARRMDILHVHQALAPWVYLLRALPGRRPVVITTIHASSREEMRQVRPRRIGGGRWIRPRPSEYLYRFVTGPIHRLVDGMAIRLSDAVTAVSGEDGWERVPNGVDAARFRPGAGGEDLRRRLGLGPGPVVLYAGTFRLRKGLHHLMVAFERIIRDSPRARLLVVGGGRGYEPSLRSLARDLRIDRHLVMAGIVENRDLPPYYDAADCVAIPSLFEGMPMVVLEAMASARPVVASRVGGIPEVIQDGVTGRLVPPGDPDTLARCIGGVLSDTEGSRRMGQRARKRVRDLHSWDRIARQYLAIAERIRRDRR
jgi:glycosyltransferase involved in cell wall biosynthesis